MPSSGHEVVLAFSPFPSSTVSVVYGWNPSQLARLESNSDSVVWGFALAGTDRKEFWLAGPSTGGLFDGAFSAYGGSKLGVSSAVKGRPSVSYIPDDEGPGIG